ncbi:C39 family peptidase [Neobacillus sp. YIM B06451]|uniref:C39 family peptidase n=1 Tax=Neobacillus sp. YIM B06451 TaxID=3070994 RepID=UPI00292DAAD6|nr:C39 family peptidase [Neobacillus sp. YIM B06451]
MNIHYFLAGLLFIQGCNGDAPIQKSNNHPRSQAIPTNERDVEKSYGHTLDENHPMDKAIGDVPDKVMLDVPLIKQNPELKYGCEVTSLAMVLNYAGVTVDKMELYRAVKKEYDPLTRPGGDIKRWGDPARGFVGDMTGKAPGYAVFDKPIVDLMDQYLPGRAVNLTDKEFSDVLRHIAAGYPAVIWTTGDFRLPDRWESWLHGKQTIRTPLDLHAVVLVGFDSDKVYVNDPLSGKKQHGVDKEQFIHSWKALKKRAVSYK